MLFTVFSLFITVPHVDLIITQSHRLRRVRRGRQIDRFIDVEKVCQEILEDERKSGKIKWVPK